MNVTLQYLSCVFNRAIIPQLLIVMFDVVILCKNKYPATLMFCSIHSYVFSRLFSYTESCGRCRARRVKRRKVSTNIENVTLVIFHAAQLLSILGDISVHVVMFQICSVYMNYILLCRCFPDLERNISPTYERHQLSWCKIHHCTDQIHYTPVSMPYCIPAIYRGKM